jgi:hypothetical protein
MTINQKKSNASFSLTRHAIKRAQQRGIKSETLNFVLDHADAEVHVGNGRFSIHISRRKLKRLHAEGQPITSCDRAREIAMVIDYCTSDIVTVMHLKCKNSGRGYRKQMPTRNTRRGVFSEALTFN